MFDQWRMSTLVKAGNMEWEHTNHVNTQHRNQAQTPTMTNRFPQGIDFSIFQ